MECIVWAVAKARVDNNKEESSDDTEEVERDVAKDEGTLQETEMEVSRQRCR